MSSKSRAIPLIEHFGPVLQGEGQLAGLPTWFVRLGGCDYNCFSCDSMHAVDAKLIAANAKVMSAKEIAQAVDVAIGTCPMITLSGGNPALWDMSEFVQYFHAESKVKVAIETQGTVWQDWIADCDYITVSPKGPNMIGVLESIKGIESFKAFMIALSDQIGNSDADPVVCVKIPVFDSADLMYATKILALIKAEGYSAPLFLSVGNSWVPEPAQHGVPVPEMHIMRKLLIERYIKLSETMMTIYPELNQCAMLPQLHVLMFGNELKR